MHKTCTKQPCFVILPFAAVEINYFLISLDQTDTLILELFLVKIDRKKELLEITYHKI